MSRQNKKESIAALHRENILAAAEELFSNKGFATATMDDISDSSGYSRRTIYSYFTGKEDILQHIVLKGLLSLQSDLMQALAFSTVFLEQYHAICRAMANYQQNSPHSFGAVEDLRVEKFDFGNIPKVTADIFAAGTAINNLLAGFIESGKERGAVRGDIKTVPAVYILWSGISALLNLVQKKGAFMEAECGMTSDEFLAYGFRQIINSILEVRI